MSSLLFNYLYSVPMLAVCGLGLVGVLMNWGKIGKGAIPAVLGCLLLLGSAFVGPLVRFAIGRMAIQMDGNQIGYLFTGVGVVTSVVEALGLAAILLAVFAGRGEPAPAGMAGMPGIPGQPQKPWG
ncbi:MAG: hypothetical protein SFU86_00785 [Pirellulaceae bacterium]|nr:hypothetical protein [Pirellulaceae bacterium]